MSENYIVINGKRAELTEEQLKQLGIEVPKANPFARVKPNQFFYCMNEFGEVYQTFDDGGKCIISVDDMHFNVANYCTDKAIIEQRALRETLNRLLWRYSMEHDGDKIVWDGKTTQRKYDILYNDNGNKLEVGWVYVIQNIGAVYFISQQVAENAIKEIVEPFMAAHPEFKW